MKADQNRVVAVDYQLEVEGAIADQSAPGAPLEYIHGTGMLLPKFEEAILGKEPGDTFEFTLSPEDGYGVHDPSYVVSLPKTAFEVNGKLMEEFLVVGRTVPMLNAAGQVVQGTVAAIEDDTVKMDFNHPMAGKTLHFTGAVVSVREATEKELTEGLHGEFLPQEGGCGGCGGGCGKNGGCEGGCEGGCGGHEGGCCGGHEGGECGCGKE